MKKSIFLKTFASITIFGVIVLMIFTGIFSTFVYDYSTSEKEDMLRKDSQQICGYVEMLYVSDSQQMTNLIYEQLSSMAAESSGNVLVTDSNGNILFTSSSSLLNELKPRVDEEILDQVRLDNFFEKRGNLGGIYKSSLYTIGVPVTTNQGNFIGAVFLSAPTPYTEGMLYELSKLMVHASFIVLIISLFVSYIVTNEIIRPLKTMSRVVHEYSKGNFKCRVPVDGEDELSQLAIAFNDMAVNLERMNDTKNNFLSNVSHDLKTPMTTIGGFVDGILDGTIPPEKQTYYLKIVSDEVRRLSRLVKGLLDVQRFESGSAKLNRTKFNLCEMVSTILIGFEQQINAKNIYIEVHFEEDDMEVFADHDMIFQVVYNLMDNAVKFVNQDGIISLRVVREDKKVKCYVKNTGTGISSQDIKHIFDRFYKADSSRGMDKKGVGLGLFIVRSIIVAHEEELNVDSMEDAYCEFSFTLPAAMG
ncbi:MAG: HAMP domain-containing sensor histidine kinase [Eubacteriales bacterium]|jgi:signal transduction histidine kinase